MRVLYISTRIDGSGGLQRSLSSRLNYLVKIGYEIYLLTTNSENSKVYFPLSNEIKHIDVKNVSFLFTYKNLIKSICKEVRPDLIILSDNGLKGFLVPYFIPKGIKIIYELHSTKEHLIKDNNKFLRILGISKILIYFSTKKFDSFVVLSEKEAKKWNLKNLKVIPNPMSLASTNQSSLENKKILFVGRLKLVKGVDFLIQIWAKISPKYPEWTLDIYGEKFDEFDIHEAINKNKLNHTVSVFEPTSNIQEKYSEASVFIMTSRIESFGLVLTEAMSCGLPCVSFDAPTGPSSIIENGKNGFLIPCFDLELFSNKIIEIIEDKELRKEMGENAKLSSLKFNQVKIMEQWNKLYEKNVS